MKYNHKVDAFNCFAASVGEHKKTKMNLNNIRSTLLLMKTYTLDELLKKKIISKSKKYVVIAKLKLLGLAPNQLAVDQMEVHTNLTFRELH